MAAKLISSKPIRFLAYGAGALVVLVLALLFVLSTEPARRWALNQVVVLLAEEGIGLKAKSLDLHVSSLNASLQQAVFFAHGKENTPFATADSISVLLLWQFGFQKPKISSIVVEHPRLDVLIDQQGKSNLPVLKERQPSSSSVSIGEISIRNGSLQFRDMQQGAVVALSVWNGKVNNFAADSYKIQMTSGAPGSATYRGRNSVINVVDADFDYLPKRITIRSAKVESNNLRFSASGAIDNMESAKLHVTSEGDVELLAHLAQLPIRGQHRAQLDLAGPIKTPSISGDVSASAFWYETHGPLDGAVKFAVDGNLTRAKIASMQARWGSASVEGSADLALNAKAGISEVHSRFQGLSSAQVATLLKADVPVSAIARGSVDARFPFTPTIASSTGKASVHLDASTGKIPVSGDVDIEAKDGVASISIPSVQALAVSATGNVQIQADNQLSGEIQLQSPDTEATIRDLRKAGLIPDSVKDGVVRGVLNATAKLGGSLKDPQAVVTANSDRLFLASTVAGAFAADATVSRDNIELRKLSIQGGPQFGLNVSGKMAAPALDFRGELRHASVRDLLVAAGVTNQAELPDGAVHSSFQIAGTTSKPSVTAAVDSNNLVILQQPLGALQANVGYDGETVSLRQLTLSRGEGSVAGDGTFHTQSETITANATIRNYKIDSLQLIDGTGIRMTVNGSVHSEGPADNAVSTIDLTAMDVVARETTAKQATLHAVVTGKQVQADVSVPDWKSKATLQASLVAPMPAEFSVTLEESPIEALSPDYIGRVTASAHGTLQLSDALKTLKGSVDLKSARVRPSKQTEPIAELRVEEPAAASYDGRYIDISTLSVLAGANSKVTVSGKIPADETDKSGELRLQGDIDLASLTQIFRIPEEGEIRGRVKTSNVVLTGGGKSWNPAGSLELIDGHVEHPSLPAPLSQVKAMFGLRNGRMDVDSGSASWLGGTVTLSGHLPFAMLLDPKQASPEKFELQADFADLKLDGLSEAADRTMGGDASFRINLSGSGLEPTMWEGRMQASKLRAKIAQVEFEQQSPLTISLHNKLATLEQFTMKGPESAFNLSGSLSLNAPYPLALRANGNINATVLQLFTNEVRAEGETKIDLAVTGTLDRPRMRGQVALNEVQAEIPAAGALLENLSGTIELNGQQVTIAKIEGDLNGGSMQIGGTVDLQGRAIGKVDMHLQSKATSWNIPAGLETAADLDLKVTGSPAAYTVSGNVKILEGSYRESLVLERGLFRALSTTAAPVDLAEAEARTPIRLDIKVESLDPIVVANDLLNGDVSANLHVLGTTDRPALLGRLDVNEGANFYLGGRNYLIDRGVITFTNQTKIEPTLDVSGHTKAGGYDITLQARGTVGEKMDTTFTADPPLQEPEIISVLVSGRKSKDLSGSDVAQDQALSYLSGNLGSTFSAQANRALGVNIPRIDPGLIADEAEPTARLTLGQDITNRLGVVYSVNLKNSSDQIWIGRFDLAKRFQTRVVRQSDATVRLQFQHDIEFGGTAPPQSTKKGKTAIRVGEIHIISEGMEPKTEKRLRSKLGLKSGKPFDFFKFRSGIEKMKSTLADDGYPEARIRSTREEKSGVLNLNIAVLTGPKVEFRYQGDVARSARKKAAKAWSQSTFDSLRIRQSTDALKEYYAAGGYYAANVDVLVEKPDASTKRVNITVDKGRKYRGLQIDLPGAVLAKEALAQTAPDKKSRVEAVVHPDRLASRLVQFYRQHGYLDVKTKVASQNDKEDHFQVSIPVTLGEQARIGEVKHQGNQELTSKAFDEAVELEKGQVYDPAAVDAAKRNVEEALDAAGLTGSDVKLTAARNGGTVDLNFDITEGQKRTVSEVAVEGNQHVSDNLVRSQIGLKPGDVVTAKKLNEARRNLYSTGAFSLADIEQDTQRAGDSSATRLIARLREVRPFEVRYGVLYDTERGPGGILDLSTRNVLGAARTLGFRGRYDSRLHEARTYFEQPSLLRLPLKFVVTGFVRRELNSTFLTDRTGGSAYMEYRWSKPYLFTFGYRLEQVHTFEREPDPLFPFDIRLRIAPLNAGFSRDKRDDILDTTRGSFMSHVAEWAPAKLGSELQYAKYFGQYFYYRPLSKPAPVPWAGGMKSRFVYAGGVRYGIASGLHGQALVPSERFFSGGSNSVRGFEQDKLGPFSGVSPIGGESIFVVNNELRFPLHKFVGGVGFVDTGNVFEQWRQFRLGDLRYTGGVGLRVRTPYFMFRLDYGFILDRRTGEPTGRLFFGIGQAF